MVAGTLTGSKRYNEPATFIGARIMPKIDHRLAKNITAVVLAGGASSRMGSDKASLQWRQRPFIAHIVERLQQQVEHVAINTNAPSDFAQFGLPLIADAFAERRGPLAGMTAALHYSTTAFTLIVPCDNPLISPQLAERLFAAMENTENDLAHAFTFGDNHYLYALLRSDLRDSLTAFMSRGDYAVRHWYANLRVSRVDFSDQPQFFRNINSADDLALLPEK